MTTKYGWLEQIDTVDASGAVIATEIKKHTITWEDADAATYRIGKVQDAQAVMDGTAGVARSNRVADAVAVAAALNTGEKGLIDYDTASKKAAAVTLNQDMVDRAKVMQLALFPEWFAQAGAAADAHIAADAQAQATAMSQAFGKLPGPRYVTTSGEYVAMSSGALLSKDDAGNVYSDGIHLEGVAAAMLCTFHGKIFAKGKTDNQWWQWNGINWGSAPLDPAKLDPGIFK